MNKKSILFLAFILIFSFCLEAQIYYYKEKTNTVVFTNIPTNRKATILRRDTFTVEANVARQIFRKQYGTLLENLCSRLNIDKKLIEAIIEVESDFNPWAVSRKGARGLMQLMPSTAKIYGVENIYNIQQNLTGGITHLKYLLRRYNNNLDLALAAYNAGSQAVKKYGGIPPYRETINYVRKVKRLYYGQSFASHRFYTGKGSTTASSAPAKQFYQWVDDQGKIRYTSYPPITTKSYKIVNKANR